MFNLSSHVTLRGATKRQHLSLSRVMAKTAEVILSALCYYSHKWLTFVNTTNDHLEIETDPTKLLLCLIFFSVLCSEKS
jgi:hypothetical protein